MTAVFADTYYFLALVNANDPGHARAVALTKGFTGRMVTTAWVLVEMADALAFSPLGRAEFLSTWNDLHVDPDAEVVGCDDQLLVEGIQLYSRRPDKEWSLTDCVSFVVMQRHGITDAWTKDHHFEQAGYVAILK